MKGILRKRYKKSRKYNKTGIEYIVVRSYRPRSRSNISIRIDLLLLDSFECTDHLDSTFRFLVYHLSNLNFIVHTYFMKIILV